VPHRSFRHVLAALLPVILCPSAAQAAPAAFTDPAAIDREVATFTGKAIGQPGGAAMPVDRRLRLAVCSSPLALSWRAQRRDTVLVECLDPGSWHVFVPVKATETGATVVARGELVTISVAGEGFTVSQSGEALDGGALGEWIRVRGLRDGGAHSDAVRARIIGPGMVEVVLP